MIKNIVFDWSGTLSNNIDVWFKTIQRMFRILGKPEGISMQELKMNFTLPYMKFYNKYFPDLTREHQMKLYGEGMHSFNTPDVFDGVKETILELYKRGYKLAVLSSDLYSTLDPEIKKTGFEEIFVEIVGDVHIKADALKHILRKNNFKKEETLFVGDTSGDVEAGKEAGVKTAGITWGMQHESKLKLSKPDYNYT